MLLKKRLERSRGRSPAPPQNGFVSSYTTNDAKIDHELAFWNANAFRPLLKGGPVQILLVFLPLGIFAGNMEWNPTIVFTLNLLGIVPLAATLSFVTEDLSTHTGSTIGALLNSTFGNAPELIVSTVALINGEIRIVQASMLGAILSNILLGLGCCLFAGGYGEDCQFNATAASTMSSLMAVAAASLIIPSALHMAFNDNGVVVDSFQSILVLSRGTSLILLILYIIYLYFQLKSHAQLFEQGELQAHDEEKEGDEATLSPLTAVVVLFGITVLIGMSAEYLVGSIDDIVDIFNINKTFIGLIILPTVGNIAEHITAIAAASKKKMDLAICVALGSSLQVALLVTPLLVILGWVVDQPMSLCFAPFDTIVFFLSVLVMTGLISDGDSNYLEGAMSVGMCGTSPYLAYPTTANFENTGTSSLP